MIAINSISDCINYGSWSVEKGPYDQFPIFASSFIHNTNDKS